MRCILTFGILFGVCRCAIADGAVNVAFERLEAAEDWRERKAAAAELAALGDDALRVVIRGAEKHENEDVRHACYQILRETFAENQRAVETIYKDGLTDEASRIQYENAFWLGEHKVYASHLRLRRVINDESASEQLRLTAAKSLAELGETDVILQLYDGLSSDRFMPRHLANLGIKALTERTLDDFGDYAYSEGAFVSGGVEAIGHFDAVDVAEKRAKRFAAIAAFSRWLREDRPDLYKHLTGFFEGVER